ncbi:MULTISPECIES: FecR domain-containing protein [unclassified Duganella]|uniref:FecR family protein n=1 Tax=unclassified Duganella TaxID=2636909 RepID=UPI00088E629C|nr:MULTISPECIES: FecR family protein [unclassified Duganella]SDF93414.1 FecR family protein [Duganella sp. OV458]SDJ11439.1 FecR family protein [Duganella sp. OV510]
MLRHFVFTAAAALMAGQALAAEAGKVIFVAGAAQVGGKAAQLNGTVQEGDLLHTGADGYVYVKTLDNGLFILRPNTEARIVSYHIDAANPSNTRIKLELLNGVARSQSGDAVKLARQNFRFNTPVAAIGVRGTDFTVFTDKDTSRVAVVAGAITISGFVGGCRAEGSGPCEGAAARELSAAQKGQLLQIQRGQGAAQLLNSPSLLPDVVAPPHVDEPSGKGSSTVGATEPSLDAKKNLTLQAQLPLINSSVPQPPVTPVLPVTPPPVVEVQAPQVVSWGRWEKVIDKAPNSTLDKAGATRVASNEVYVLFRSDAGAPYVLPERGNAGFALSSSEAYVRDTVTLARTAASLSNGQLNVDFGRASYTTSFDVLDQGSSYKMATFGNVAKDGTFNSSNQFALPSNMQINGALSGDGTASYLFQGLLTSRRVISGVTVWAPTVAR